MILTTTNPDHDGREITIDYLDVTTDDIKAQIVSAATWEELDAVKVRALARLDIEFTPDRDRDPLQAYMRAMHARNDLEFAEPAHPLISQALELGGAMRFIWWLA